MVIQQGIHHDIRPGAAVVNIPDDVHMVHRQPLDDLADGLDDLGGLADINDGADDDVIIIPLVRLLIADVEQFIDDVGITLGQGVAYLGAGIFGG